MGGGTDPLRLDPLLQTALLSDQNWGACSRGWLINSTRVGGPGMAPIRKGPSRSPR
jgi:hypothetical protein